MLVAVPWFTMAMESIKVLMAELHGNPKDYLILVVLGKLYWIQIMTTSLLLAQWVRCSKTAAIAVFIKLQTVAIVGNRFCLLAILRAWLIWPFILQTEILCMPQAGRALEDPITDSTA